ncbi:hypothetical protein BD770DRAFT_427717 [Pilaira anomala]|nr:hypothetical protein BD770DRAFT_427717 [Pilaira anomala]
MNHSFKVLSTYYHNAEKEPICFFLLQVCFLALVCYDFELDCCLKKVCFKKRKAAALSKSEGLFKEMEEGMKDLLEESFYFVEEFKAAVEEDEDELLEQEMLSLNLLEALNTSLQ